MSVVTSKVGRRSDDNMLRVVDDLRFGDNNLVALHSNTHNIESQLKILVGNVPLHNSSANILVQNRIALLLGGIVFMVIVRYEIEP